MRSRFIGYVLGASLASAPLSIPLPALAAEAISDGVVKIGILNDQSGVYADFGGKWSYEAAQMAAEDYGGTVLGAPIEIVTADHQNKPDIASNIAREWYDTEQVDSIMELTTSSVALAVQGLSKEKKKIDIVTGAATVIQAMGAGRKAARGMKAYLGLRDSECVYRRESSGPEDTLFGLPRQEHNFARVHLA